MSAGGNSDSYREKYGRKIETRIETLVYVCLYIEEKISDIDYMRKYEKEDYFYRHDRMR